MAVAGAEGAPLAVRLALEEAAERVINPLGVAPMDEEAVGELEGQGAALRLALGEAAVRVAHAVRLAELVALPEVVAAPLAVMEGDVEGVTEAAGIATP